MQKDNKMWNPLVNQNFLIRDFKSEIDHDRKASGNINSDYIGFCKKFSIVPCPSFQIGTAQPSKSYCRLFNRVLDISSWRAMLLALSATGCLISEITLHNVQLTAQHITELALALDEIGKIDILRLDFIDFVGEVSANRALKPIFTTSCAIDYISLRGNGLADSFIVENFAAIQSNLSVHAINFGNNLISDVGVAEIFKILRINCAIKHLSLKNNRCNGACLDGLVGLISGSLQVNEDESITKALTKQHTERNKQIKEKNKKRKKLGLIELEELTPLPEKRVFRAEKGAPYYIVNRSLLSVDFSWNPLQIGDISRMCTSIEPKMEAIQPFTDPCNFELIIKGEWSDAELVELRVMSACEGFTLTC